MKWQNIQSDERLIVTALFNGRPTKMAVTKLEFEKSVHKEDFIQVFHCKSGTYLDLDDTAEHFDDWDLNKTAEKVAEWQTETCRDLARMVHISDQFFHNIDLEYRESNEWFWNALPILDGLIESLNAFSGGQAVP